MSARYSVAFRGGPFDGQTWPCAVRPDVLSILDGDGKLHIYSCIGMSDNMAGHREYTMARTDDVGQELTGKSSL